MAANFILFTLFSTLLFFFLIHPSMVSFVAATSDGYSLHLIHRDSPLSPFYNPSDSQFNRLKNAFYRSISRAAHFKHTSATIQSQMRPVPGEYLMKVSIGTPPVEILGIADTGSDLTWIQCKPCPECYTQKAPLFDPQASSTYKNLTCNSQPCKALGATSDCSDENVCEYTLAYADSSYASGDLAIEKFTFGSTSGPPASIQNVVFGCGHDNDGSFNETGQGIIGLGVGALSIINQLNESISGRFSYCLVPLYRGPNVTSKINFGSNAVVSGSGVVSTPIIENNTYGYYYYLTLEGISVGNKTLEFETTSNSKAAKAKEGNIVIDSGTTFTRLPRAIYKDLESALKAAIGAQTSPDPDGDFDLCYRNEGYLNLPTIRVHFKGADVDLPPTSTFVEVKKGLVCLGMFPVDDTGVFGNLAQMNFLIGYDLVNKKLSFMPTDCTKH